MLNLQTTSNGVLLPIRAQPRSRQNAIVGIHDGRLKIAVIQAPERGKANDAVIQVLCDELNLRKTQIKLISGSATSQKTVRIMNVTAEDLNERITQRIDSTG
ncbi:MAG: DUF167 domain-containing protein [Planctomycetaceae bacterium]